jgi:hypothetical protein
MKRMFLGISELIISVSCVAACSGSSGTNRTSITDAGIADTSAGDAGTSVAALFQTVTRSGTVELPAGVKMPLSSLSVQSSIDQQPVSSSGAFTLNTFISPGQVILVTDPAGNPMLMGFLDATHSVINSASTAQLFLWFGSGAQSLPYDDQEQLLPHLGSTPGLTAVTQAISAALVASPDAFASQNAAVTAAVTKVLAPQMLTPPGKAIQFDLTITSSTPDMQSGLDVISDGTFSAHIQNTYLRRAWADIQRVSETTTDGQGHTTTQTLSPAVEVTNFEVPPVAGYGGLLSSASQIVNYIGGASTDTPWTPVNTSSVNLPLTAGSSQTTYQVTIMGWGSSEGAAFANLNQAQTDERKNICVTAFFQDVVWPIISSVVLGQSKLLGGISEESFVTNFVKNMTADILGNDTLQPFVNAITQGQLTNALATVFYHGLDPATIAASNSIRGFFEVAFRKAIKAAVAANPEINLSEEVNFVGKLNTFSNVAGQFLEGANLTAMLVEVPLENKANAWMVNANPEKVVLNPKTVTIATGSMQSFTASLLNNSITNDAGVTPYSFLWTNTATTGTLSGPGSGNMMPAADGGAGTSYCSSSAMTTYTAESDLDGGMGMDMVTVSVYGSSNCKGTLIGTSAPSTVTVTGSLTLAANPSTIAPGGTSTLTATAVGLSDTGTPSYRFSCPNCTAGALMDTSGTGAVMLGAASPVCLTVNQIDYVANTAQQDMSVPGLTGLTDDGGASDTVTVTVFAGADCQGSSFGTASAQVTIKQPCNNLTTAPVATCNFSEAVEPTEQRQTLPAAPDGTYVLTNATVYGMPLGDAGEPAASNCGMVLTISGTSMEVFTSGVYGDSGQANYQINWVTGGPWLNITKTCATSAGFDPLLLGGNQDENPSNEDAQLSYDDANGGLVLGTPFNGAGAGGGPIILTFTAQ